MNNYKNAEIVADQSGKQYHIGVNADEISSRIILVGDPERATLISTFFDNIRVDKKNREFQTYTGQYQGLELTVMSVGIGAPAMEIAIVELCQLKNDLSIIRCGTCGALQEDIKIGDLVVTSAALALENTTSYFVEPGYPAVASYEISLALLKAAEILKLPYHYGITTTAPGFYGAQGRHVPPFPLRDEELINRLIKQGIKNLEMECSCLFILASLAGARAGMVAVVFADRRENHFVSQELKKDAEIRAVTAALRAHVILAKMDKQKKTNKYWLPIIQ